MASGIYLCPAHEYVKSVAPNDMWNSKFLIIFQPQLKLSTQHAGSDGSCNCELKEENFDISLTGRHTLHQYFEIVRHGMVLQLWSLLEQFGDHTTLSITAPIFQQCDWTL